jgi:hypothetical protein
MKKHILSLLFISTAYYLQAQDAIPTREQTINFLKENFLQSLQPPPHALRGTGADKI